MPENVDIVAAILDLTLLVFRAARWTLCIGLSGFKYLEDREIGLKQLFYMSQGFLDLFILTRKYGMTPMGLWLNSLTWLHTSEAQIQNLTTLL